MQCVLEYCFGQAPTAALACLVEKSSAARRNVSLMRLPRISTNKKRAPQGPLLFLSAYIKFCTLMPKVMAPITSPVDGSVIGKEACD